MCRVYCPGDEMTGQNIARRLVTAFVRFGVMEDVVDYL